MTQKKDHTVLIILAIVLSAITYQYVLHEMVGILNDYHGHLYVYFPMFTQENWLEGWQTVPYCMWHVCVLALNKLLFIPLEIAGGYVSCIFSLLAYFVLYWMVRRVTLAVGNVESSAKAAVIAFGISMVQALYFPWLDTGNRFLGVYSMNPIHNPTQMCVRVFSLLCFCLVYDIWGMQKKQDYKGIFFKVENGLKKYYIMLALLLFLSTVAKPTFVEMFVPAVAFIMLGEWLHRVFRKDGSAKAYFTHCLNMLWCAVPALLYIGLQFIDYYILGANNNAETSVIITKWLEVWGMHSENIPLSILLGMAFPLFLFLIDAKFFFYNDMGRLALVGYIVGFFEAALLGEGGDKLGHSNFLWPLMSAMLVVWVVSILRLLVLERTKSETRLQRVLIDCAWVLFWIHVFFGLMYIKLGIMG